VVLHVTADGIADEAITAVSAVPGVTGTTRTAVGLDVTVQSGSDVSADVSKALVLSGARLRELKQSERSLEDLFLALTKGGRV
jgi:hypothetical protein